MFLTDYEGRPAAIKVVTAGGRSAERMLAQWRLASKVSHPNLIRLLEMGRAQLDSAEVAYLVMEYAEENLAQVLTERTLTPAEAQEMLAPALDAMACIHREGFVHARLTPENIMATGDCLKLSSDSLRRLEEVEDPGSLDPAYRAPELSAGARYSQAADIWMLGMTLFEVLTQRLPAGNGDKPALPREIGTPLTEILGATLRQSAQERATAAELSAILSGQGEAQKKSRLTWYAIAAAAIVVVALVVWLFRSRPASAPAPEPVKTVAAPETAPAPAPPPAATPRAAKAKPPAPPREDATESGPSAAPTLAEVESQVMPNILEKARRSIQGKLVVAARVHVDSYGAVTEASIDPPAHSRYFSSTTLKAVRRWKFRPVKQGDTFVPQEWIVRFEYTRDDTRVALERASR